MKHRNKRLLSLLLTFAMVFSMLPVGTMQAKAAGPLTAQEMATMLRESVKYNAQAGTIEWCDFSGVTYKHGTLTRMAVCIHQERMPDTSIKDGPGYFSLRHADISRNERSINVYDLFNLSSEGTTYDPFGPFKGWSGYNPANPVYVSIAIEYYDTSLNQIGWIGSARNIVITSLPDLNTFKKLEVSLTHATIDSKATHTQQVSSTVDIQPITVTADSGYALPNTITGATNGLVYTKTNATTATISGKMTADTNLTVTAVMNTKAVTITLGDHMTLVSGTLEQSVTPGSPIANITVKSATGYNLPPTYTGANGLVFTNYGNGTGTISGATDSATVNNATPITYSVVYNGNTNDGGTTVPVSTLTYAIAGKAAENTFTKAGHTFTAWNTQADGLGTAYAVNADLLNLKDKQGDVVNLYAQWAIENYSLALTLAHTTETTATTQHNYDSVINKTLHASTGYLLPAALSGDTLTAAGLTYKQVGGGASATITGNIKQAAAATITATPITYKVNYNINDGDSGTMAQSTHTYDLEQTLTANGFTKVGYDFNGWSTSAGVVAKTYDNNQSVKNLKSTQGETLELYAQWKIKQFSTNITAGANTTVSGNVTNVNYNTPVTITVQANTGYTLPKTWTNAALNGLIYVRTDFDTATISGNLKQAVTATVPAAVAIPMHGVTYTLTGLETSPAGAATVSEKDTTLSFTLKPTEAGKAVLPADVTVKVGSTLLTKTGTTAKYEYNPVTGVVSITYTRTAGANGLIGFDGDVVITAKAVAIPQITVEPGTGGVGTQIKVTPDVGTGFTIEKVVIGAEPKDITLEKPYIITPEIVGGLKKPATITVTITGPDGIKITTKTTVAVTTLTNATKNTSSSNVTVAPNGVTSVTNPTVAEINNEKPFISVTPISSTYTTTGVGDGTGAVTDKDTAFAQGATTLTATPKPGAYFDGFYVGGVKVTSENVVEKLGTGATLSADGKVLKYTPAGTDKKITATYRNLLGEVNVGTVNDIKAVFEDTGFNTAFTTGAEELEAFNKLAPATQAQALNMLDKITPTAGYTDATAFVTDLGNVAELFTVVNTGAGLDKGDYTDGTWAEFDKANEDAKTLLNAETITPTNIIAVKDALNTAINALQFKTLTLLIKADDNWITKISTTVSATKAGRSLAPAPNAMSSLAYFPAIGTDAKIKILKTQLTKDDVFAATVNGNYSLVFSDGTGVDSAYLVATVSDIKANTTVVFTFNTKKVDLEIPAITGTKITTGGTDGGTDVGGKTITVGLEKPLVITVTPDPGKMIYPGTEITVTIGGVKKEYPIGPDGTIDIPETDVTGKLVIDKGSLLKAVTDVTPEVVGLLVTDIEGKYKNKHQEYTPETISKLNKAIETAKKLVEQPTAPTVKDLEDAYKAVVSAEKGLKKQFALTLTGTVEPTVDTAFKPTDWDKSFANVYGEGTKAEFVAPGITKVTTTGTPDTVKYFVQDGYSVKMTGTPTDGKVVTSVAYTVGSNNGTSVADNIGGKFTFTIPSVNAATTVNTVNEAGKAIVITPLPITGPGTLNPGKITGGTGEMTVDPGTGGKVTELIVDEKVITLPTEEVLKEIRKEIKETNDKKPVTVNQVINPTPAIPGIDGGIKITGITGTSPNVTAITGEVKLSPDGHKAQITIEPGTGKITVNKILPTVSVPANPDVDDTFEEITIDPDTGKAKVTFPDVDTGTHEVGGKIDHKTHPLPTGEIDIGVAPATKIIGTITSKNEPELPGIDPGKGIENRDVVVTIEPKDPNQVITGGGIKYVVTDPLTGVATETTITLPGNATTGTAVVDPNTGVITVTIPAVKVTGEITFPELGKNIVDLETAMIDKLLEVAKEVLKSKDKGTFEPADPANDKWTAIKETETGSAAKVAKDLLDEILAGTSKTDEEKKSAITNLVNAIKAITDKRNDVSTIPTGGSGGSGTATPNVGTGITNPGTITTPVTGTSEGRTDNKLIMSPTTDDLIITGITTEPGYVPDKVIVTVIDPVTGVGTEVEIPLTGGTGGNLSENSPFIATIPSTNPVTSKPATTEKTLKDVLKELKPGDITGIKVVGKKDGNVILPTADAIKTASNVLTGNTNASGTSAGVTAITLNPSTGVIAPKVGLTITATLGKDDYSETEVATALDRTYEFAGIKVDGKVIKEGTDYTVDLTTEPGKATIKFTAAQVAAIAGDGKAIGKIEILTTPTNPQYKTFVNDFGKLDELYKNYIKPTATPLEKVTFEELVAKLNSQLTETDTANLKKSEQLTADNKKHLIEEKAQITTFTETIKSKDKAEKLAVSIDEMYAKLKAEVIGAGDELPVGEKVSPSVAAAILANENAIETAKNEFDALSPVEKDQISIDTQKKLQNAIDALAAAIKATKTPSEIAKELIGALPSTADVLKNSSAPAVGLKDKTDTGNNIYGINTDEITTGTNNKAALAELETLNKMLAAAEKAAQAEGATITVADRTKLDDLRTAVEKEYRDYAQLFTNENMADKTNKDDDTIATGSTYPNDKITNWVTYPNTLIKSKGEYDKLPAKVKEAIDLKTAPENITDIFKEVFPNVDGLVGVTAESILAELVKDGTTTPVSYILTADLDNAKPVEPSELTGAEWAEKVVKAYEKFAKLPTAEQDKVNNALTEGNKMADLYKKASAISPNSEESKNKANKFIADHLTEYGNIITAVTDSNKALVVGGESDWSKLSFGAQKAVNEKLKALGSKTYPQLLSDAKALMPSTGDGDYDGGSTGGGSVNVSIDPGKTGGKITVSPSNPKPGQEVTITVTVDPGYEIGTLLITDKKGKELPKLGNNPYIIIVPEGGFNIKGEFVKAGEGKHIGPFKDVPTDKWYAPAIEYVYNNKLFEGMSAEAFEPNSTMTRGMFVTVLGRLAKVDVSKWQKASKFPDVASDKYYTAYVAWGESQGILLGYGNGNYGPNDLVTREQMAAILYRYVKLNGNGYVGAWVYLLPYSDVEDISGYAFEGISWCTQNQIIAGKGNNTLEPKGNASRAEVAQLLYNFCNMKKK